MSTLTLTQKTPTQIRMAYGDKVIKALANFMIAKARDGTNLVLLMGRPTRQNALANTVDVYYVSPDDRIEVDLNDSCGYDLLNVLWCLGKLPPYQRFQISGELIFNSFSLSWQCAQARGRLANIIKANSVPLGDMGTEMAKDVCDEEDLQVLLTTGATAHGFALHYQSMVATRVPDQDAIDRAQFILDLNREPLTAMFADIMDCLEYASYSIEFSFAWQPEFNLIIQTVSKEGPSIFKRNELASRAIDFYLFHFNKQDLDEIDQGQGRRWSMFTRKIRIQ